MKEEKFKVIQFTKEFIIDIEIDENIVYSEKYTITYKGQEIQGVWQVNPWTFTYKDFEIYFTHCIRDNNNGNVYWETVRYIGI